MKKLASLLVVAGVAAGFLGVSAPANADEFVSRYTYYVNGVAAPSSTVLRETSNSAVLAAPGGCGTVLTQPAIAAPACGTATVLTQPAVVEQSICAPAVVSSKSPIMVEHHEDKVPHLFHLGLWPLIDFSIF